MSTQVLPETAAVYWRPRVDERSLARRGRPWTLTTVAHTIPFAAAAVFLFLLEPLSAPGRRDPARARVGDPGAVRQARRERAAAPAARAARPRSGPRSACSATSSATRRASCTPAPALVLERGALGVWVVGEAGAVLVRPGGRRVYCWCVHVDDRRLPSADRIAHLLLALRTDEAGFATVANLAFSGAPAARPPPPGARHARPALDAARSTAGRTAARDSIHRAM